MSRQAFGIKTRQDYKASLEMVKSFAETLLEMVKCMQGAHSISKLKQLACQQVGNSGS